MFLNRTFPAVPIGRIDFLGTNGIVGESVEYTDAAKFERDVKRENYSGAPMSITLYRGAGGQTIPHDFIYDMDPPPQGFYVEAYENKDEAEQIAGADDEDEWEP
jgi:hypothetical protein